jgi:glutamine amidotransferase
MTVEVTRPGEAGRSETKAAVKQGKFFMIIIVDYSVGNIKSVCNAFRHIGCQVRLSSDPAAIESAAGLVLPGVAAFGYAVSALGSLAELIKKVALSGKPLLGICVGYQMLFDQSAEYGRHKGLGLVKGNVISIPSGRTIPHMGWNLVKLPDDMDLFAGLGEEKYFYFAHSFYADVTDHQARIAYTDYGFNMSASVQKANIYGVQFHPEKSSNAGLKVLQNFAEICERKNLKC